MEDIAEHFGLAFLQMIAGGILLASFLTILQDGGILNEAVRQYMSGICG